MTDEASDDDSLANISLEELQRLKKDGYETFNKPTNKGIFKSFTRSVASDSHCYNLRTAFRLILMIVLFWPTLCCVFERC